MQFRIVSLDVAWGLNRSGSSGIGKHLRRQHRSETSLQLACSSEPRGLSYTLHTRSPTSREPQLQIAWDFSYGFYTTWNVGSDPYMPDLHHRRPQHSRRLLLYSLVHLAISVYSAADQSCIDLLVFG